MDSLVLYVHFLCKMIVIEICLIYYVDFYESIICHKCNQKFHSNFNDWKY